LDFQNHEGELKMKINEMLGAYEVKADRETGEWLTVPEYIGDVYRGGWDKMMDTDDTHYDTFESLGETCAVRVEWA
jgi:hypothetical protein